jgi:hypothetical protein
MEGLFVPQAWLNRPPQRSAFVKDVSEEHYLFVKRVAQFQNIRTIYTDLLTGHYVPSIGAKRVEEIQEADSTITAEMVPTMMFVLYSFFFSLVEDSSDGLDAFRIWRKKYPEEEQAIEALEALVKPLRNDLRSFRNKLGFHGSRSFTDESKGLELFANHSGERVMQIMTRFTSLNAGFLIQDAAERNDSEEDRRKARSWIDANIERCKAMTKVASSFV